jgi:hypothetical protein
MTDGLGHDLRQTNRLIQRELRNRPASQGLNIGEWHALRARGENA